jgi:hypothetical protein
MRVDPRRERASEDEVTERTILALLLSSHPAARTTPELIREIGNKELVTRALCALADYGLLEFEGGKSETLRPSLAARSCHRLDSW